MHDKFTSFKISASLSRTPSEQLVSRDERAQSKGDEREEGHGDGSVGFVSESVAPESRYPDVVARGCR